jgi:hypothetical protein
VPSHETCRREIETLHEFFVDWYTGAVGRDAYDRVERALASEFEMVTPAGDRRGYADVVVWLDLHETWLDAPAPP